MTFVPEPGFEAIHCWNAIPLMTQRPFVITFEDYLPRTPDDRRIGWLERHLRDRLLSDRCVALVATSEYAVRQFRRQHSDFEGLPELLAKTEVIYPATPLRRSAPKAHSNRLRLLFVGRDFMRKGGPVVLRAHEKLRRSGVPVETTIVSSLQWTPHDYVGPPDAAYVGSELKGMAQEGVVHHRGLPSPRVYDLMDQADFLVFPTFHDTFGFVSVEAMATGTPVVATSTCVLPEVVSPGASGFLLPFENDPEVGKWVWLYRNRESGYLDAYRSATDSLSEALFRQMATAWEERADYERLSAGAIAAARDRFNPEHAARRLESLYARLRRRA